MEKNKLIAALLAFFGGTFGLHKFYLDDPGSGVFYIMLTFIAGGVFPIASLLGVFEAIRLFTMSEQQFDAKYNKQKAVRDRLSRDTRRSPASNKSGRQRERRDMERSKYKYNKATSKSRSNPFRKSADRKLAEYDLEGALADYAKAEEITPADKQTDFNLACIYSLKEDTTKSLYHLDQAIKKGFKNKEKMETAEELAFLRIQPEFTAFINSGYKLNKANANYKAQEQDIPQNEGLLAQLNKLKELRNKGLLSEKEFSYEKEKLSQRR